MANIVFAQQQKRMLHSSQMLHATAEDVGLLCVQVLKLAWQVQSNSGAKP